MSKRSRRDLRASVARRVPQDPHRAYLQARRKEAVAVLSALHGCILARRRPFGYAMLAVALGLLASANRFAGRVLP